MRMPPLAKASTSVLAIAAAGDELAVIRAKADPVRAMTHPPTGPIKGNLVNFSRHHSLADAPATELSNGAADATQSDPVEVVTQFGKLRVGVIEDADSGNRPALSS
jgi:hypothetical protein